MGLAGKGAGVALAPWLAWNIAHRWQSLSSPPQHLAHDGYFDHLQRFVVRGWPLALGLEVPLRLAGSWARSWARRC